MQDGVYNPFPNYQFTGTIHPWYPLSPRRQVPDHILRPEYAVTGMSAYSQFLRTEMNTVAPCALGKPLRELKVAGQPPKVLTKEEQEKMRTVCRVRCELPAPRLATQSLQY